MECFVAKGSKKYDILPELEDMVFSDSELKSSKHSSHKRKKVCLVATHFAFLGVSLFHVF